MLSRNAFSPHSSSVPQSRHRCYLCAQPEVYRTSPVHVDIVLYTFLKITPPPPPPHFKYSLFLHFPLPSPSICSVGPPLHPHLCLSLLDCTIYCARRVFNSSSRYPILERTPCRRHLILKRSNSMLGKINIEIWTAHYLDGNTDK